MVEREGSGLSAERRVKAAQEEVAQLMSFVESVSRKNRHLVQAGGPVLVWRACVCVGGRGDRVGCSRAAAGWLRAW